jgi:hypothetical protein
VESDSGLVDMRTLAATARAGATPPAVSDASELSGAVGRRDSVVGVRVVEPASGGVPGWVWGGFGCLLVLGVGLGGMLVASDSMKAGLVDLVTRARSTVAAVEPPPPVPAFVPSGAVVEPLQNGAVAKGSAPRLPSGQRAAANPAAHPSDTTRAPRAPRARRAAPQAAAPEAADDESAVAASSSQEGGEPEAEAVEGKPTRTNPARPETKGSIDSLLASAAKEPEAVEAAPVPRAEKSAEESASDPAAVLKDLKTTMEGLQPRMRQCFRKFQIPGVAEVKVLVAPTGSLESSSIRGEFEGTPTGECVINELASTSFPSFKGGPLRVTHSYVLR